MEWHKPLYIENAQIILPNEEENKAGLAIIREINAKNKDIESIKCDLTLEGSQGGFATKLKGNLAYQKNTNFRLTAKSFVGKESDIGSNKTHFWFWGKRLKPPALHYALHTDLHKTRLKTPFNPLWMMESISLNQLNEKARIYKTENYWAIVESRISPLNKPVSKVTLIDPIKKTIIGHYLIDERGIVASTEITEFTKINNHYVPKTMEINWHIENAKMIWKLKNIEINTYIEPSRWVIPNMKSKINMGIN
jgi:hypothetical protein